MPNNTSHGVPVTPILCHHPPQHLLQCLVKSLDQPIRLRVVHGCAELLYLEEVAEVRHETRHEGSSLVSQYFLGDSHLAE